MAKNNSKEHSRSNAKTKAILEGAMQEFLAHGYAAASMDKIAKAAQVSKATIYSHFDDKEQLFSAVIQDLVKDKFQAVMSLQEHQSLEQDPKQVLSQIAINMLSNAKKDQTFQNFMRIILGESGRFPELAQTYVRSLAKPAIDTLSHYLQSHPNLKLGDSEAAARIVIGTLVYFVILQEMLHGKDILPLENDRLVNALTDLIVKYQP